MKALLTKAIPLLVAIAMPLCCCVVNIATGANDSCCVEVIEPTCCDSAHAEEDVTPLHNEKQPDEQESCDGAFCCIKICTEKENWKPPVLLAGDDITPTFITLNLYGDSICYLKLKQPSPQYEPIASGFCNAPPMRGSIILEV